MALLTAAQARALYVPSLTSVSDTDLDTAIARVEVVLASWLGWPSPTDGGPPALAASTHTIYLDGPSESDRAVLVLPLWPVTAIASIYDDELLAYGASTLVASTAYVLDKSRGRVRLLPTATHAWSTAPMAIKVTCSAGFATTDPHAVEAVGRQLSHQWTLKDVQGRVSQSAGGRSTTYVPAAQVCAEARGLLGQYRTMGM